MKRALLLACLGATCLLAPPAHADVTPLPGGPKLVDCRNARDPARCEARIKARKACRDKRGDTKRMCMEAYMVSPDCARAEQPKRCMAVKKAEHTCRHKHGKNHKSCMQAELRRKPGKPAQPPAQTAVNTAS